MYENDFHVNSRNSLTEDRYFDWKHQKHKQFWYIFVLMFGCWHHIDKLPFPFVKLYNDYKFSDATKTKII